jgi:integrase
MADHRRGRGEGGISQRTDGRWVGRLDVVGIGGKRKRKHLYGKTRRAVATQLGAALQKVAIGSPLATDERQTVLHYLQWWLAQIAKPRVRQRTWITYEAAIARHIGPHLGSRRLTQLTPQHVQAWMGALETNGVPASQRRYARVVLRAALNTAVRWRLISQNAAALVDPPRVTRREITPLDVEQSKQLIKTANGHALESFVTVGLSCGLRVGESLGLTWAAIDLKAGTLTVRQSLQRTGGDPAARRPLLADQARLRLALRQASPTDTDERQRLTLALREIGTRIAKVKTSLQLVEPKSKQSRRTIALPTMTIEALKTHRRRQLEARLVAGRAWQERDLVFTTSIGTPIEMSNLSKAFKALLAKAGLPAIRIHDLRHTAATLLLTQGVDPRTIMETLGHSQISLTLNTYAHVLPRLQRDAADRMNRILVG